jgi:phenylalanyl-tRNA synthetase beta chain
MANIKLPRKTLEKHIGKIDEKMQNQIALFGTPVESITEDEIELEIFPNRPDLLSFQGFLRAFKAYLGKEKGLKSYKVSDSGKNYYINIEKSVKDIRPYTTCAIVKGITLDNERIKEIIDLQEKLHNTLGRKRKKAAIGIYPFDKIVFPVTYKAIEPDKIKFIPLGMQQEMSGLQILQKHPTGREYSHLLAGKAKFPIFEDANGNILSMPPIINSDGMGKITIDTKDVFIECSGFDINILKRCLNIISTTLSDMGGEIYSLELRYSFMSKAKTPDLTPEKIKLSIENAERILGLKITEKQAKDLLERMGYDIQKNIISVPAWRADILHEVDIIEDIAIAYGYDNINPEIPEVSTLGKENRYEIIKRKLSEILANSGYLELSNYHLTNAEYQNHNMGTKPKNNIEISTAKTNYNTLRQNLTHYLLKTFSDNSDAEYPQDIFEIGTVFPNSTQEREDLAIASAPGNFTKLKQILLHLSKMLNIGIEVKNSNSAPDYFIEGRAGLIKINGKDAGFIGEIHPRILRNWKIKMPVSLLEIDLEEIFKKLD